MDNIKSDIYQKIFNITTELKPIEKDGSIAFGSTKYGYQSVEGLVNAIKPLMTKHKLIMYPEYTEVTISEKGLTSIKVTYIFRSIDDNSFIEVQVPGQGYDSADKGSNKAMSGALKYALKQVFMVEAGEDDVDRTASESYQAAPRVSDIAKQKNFGNMGETKKISGVEYTYKEGLKAGKKWAGWFPPRDRKDLTPQWINLNEQEDNSDAVEDALNFGV